MLLAKNTVLLMAGNKLLWFIRPGRMRKENRMESKLENACNYVEYSSEDVRKAGRRIFVVVDGREQEFQRELDRLGLTRVKEWFSVKDHRTGCFLRYYKVRPRDGDLFQQAALALAEHMPALGYPDYADYALCALVEFDCISAEAAQAQAGKDCGAGAPLPYFPDAVYNVAGMRTDPPRSLLWKDVMVIEGCGQEGRKLLVQRGFGDLKIFDVYAHKAWPRYLLFTCAIPIRRWDAFIDVMAELEARMLVLGYRDYEEACTAMFRSLKERLEGSAED